MLLLVTCTAITWICVWLVDFACCLCCIALIVFDLVVICSLSILVSRSFNSIDCIHCFMFIVIII